jgi:hypothetical protein
MAKYDCILVQYTRLKFNKSLNLEYMREKMYNVLPELRLIQKMGTLTGYITRVVQTLAFQES